MSTLSTIYYLPSTKKVAIVHDWLVGGGAELVVLELHRMFPDAPIYTSYCTDEWRERLDGKVVTGWLQWWPFSKLRKYLAILRIWWFSHLDLSGYDVVISSTGNGEAKGIRVGRSKIEGGRWYGRVRKLFSRSTTYHLPSTKEKSPVHICYCHSPTHFYWRHYRQYVKSPGFGPFASLGLRLLVKPLQRWDKNAAQRPNVMIANSTHIKHDIKKYYGRDSTVIHPPVDTLRFSPSSTSHLPSSTRSGFITVGRQVPYKRVDLIVDACSRLGVPLTVVGSGPEHADLVRRAGPSVKFLGHMPHEAIPQLIADAEAFILAALEDFGITPVEALAAGTPVIAYRAGGALDYVNEGDNGLFFDEQTIESLCGALREFEKAKFSHKKVVRSAQDFSIDNFHGKISEVFKDL